MIDDRISLDPTQGRTAYSSNRLVRPGLAVGWRIGPDRRGRAVHVTASLRHVAGAWPTSFLNARLNAASDS